MTSAPPPSYAAATGKDQYPPDPNQAPYPPGPNQAPYPPGPNQAPYPPGPNQAPYPPGPNQAPYPPSAPYSQGPNQPPYPGGGYNSPQHQPYIAPQQPGYTPSQTGSTARMHDPEEGTPINSDDGYGYNGYNFEFTEKSIRLGFIRKVYSILLCQLLVTVLFICVFVFVDPIREFALQNTWLWIVAMVATFVCLIVLACCPDVRRKWPLNFIMLSLFTIFESFLLGAVAATYDWRTVLMAVGITAAVALGLTLFAFQTKWDFTMCSGGLLVLLIILICFGFLAAIIRSYWLSMVYSALGALIFSMYLVFDTQLMLGGKHKYSLSPEEYIFAALNLYLDIINMFLFILALVGGSRGS